MAICALAAAVLAPGARLLAQSAEGNGFRAYPLAHVPATVVEPQLSKLLSGLSGPTEVVADAKNNRVLVRGTPEAHRLAEQLLLSLDRPMPAPAAPAELRAYNVPAAALNETAARLHAEFGAAPNVRLATDERTSQLLVLAPPDVHAAIAQRLGVLPAALQGPAAGGPPMGLPPAAAQAPGGPASAAATRNIQLSRRDWPTVAAELAGAFGPRLSAPAAVGADTLRYRLTLSGGATIELLANQRTGAVDLYGDAPLLGAMARLLAVIDQRTSAAAQTMRIVSLPAAQQAPVRRAAAAIQANDQAAAMGVVGGRRLFDGGTGGGTLPAIAQLFQPRAGGGNEGQPAPPTAAQPAQNAAEGGQLPAGADQPAGAAAGEMTSGLVGPVQVEFLEGYDVLIISGNQRDVERVLQIIEDIERLSVETEPVIEVLPLKHVGSEAVATIVSQLFEQVLAPRQGQVSITALVKPNALLLIGRAESVRNVVELVNKLDQPVGPASQFAVFPLRHASVTAVQAILQEFFADRAGLGPRLRLTADYRANALVVQASPRDLAEAAELIKRLDVPSSQAVNELRIFPLRSSLATELAPVLQAAISGEVPTGVAAAVAAGQAGPAGSQQAQQARSTMLRFLTIDAEGQRLLKSGLLTDVRITADARANALVVSAPAESMELIGALIQQLDQTPAAEAQIKVFTIVNGDASSLMQMLQTLFGQQQQQAGFGAFAQAAQGAFQGENPLVPLRFSVDQRTNSIIASGSAGDLNVVEAILLRLDESDVRQRQSVVYRLKNSPAVDVANAINEFLRSERAVQQVTPGVVSPFEQIEREVVVVPEPVSNSLIVSATPRYFEEIKRLVEDLDRRPPMVMIQVLIAEVTLNNTDEFGVELGLQDSVLFDRSLLGDLVTTTESSQQAVAGGGTITATDQIIQGATLTPGYLFNSPTLPNSGSDLSRSTSNTVGTQGLTNFSVGRINGELGFGGLVLSASSESVSILIRALSESRRLDVLSRPQVMTLDNQPAFVQVGSRVPRVRGVTTNEAGQTSSVVDENVGLILGVTPRISPDGLVVMEIDAEKSALGPEAEGVPISISATGDVVRQPVINTTTASTTVSAVSGQTVVLGGLITKARAVTRRRVPLLSEIPVLGHLFRYDAEVNQRTELLIIMTPHIVASEDDANLIKQIEAARMSWCLADVRKIHGDIGVAPRCGEWADDEVMVIYPDQQPVAPEMVPAPAPSVETKPQQPLPPPGEPSMLQLRPQAPPQELVLPN